MRPLKKISKLINNELALNLLWLLHILFLEPHLMMHVCTYTETERKRIPLTRVNLPVTAHSIGINNVLEARGKFVGPYQGRGSIVGGDTIDKGRHCRSAFSLKD